MKKIFTAFIVTSFALLLVGCSTEEKYYNGQVSEPGWSARQKDADVKEALRRSFPNLK
ncbi:MAG: hypothetical protein ACK5MJ_03125 [Alphaproteobacteria bacterium]